MPKVTFRTADGTDHHVDAELGESVMQTAIANDVPGIIAECGGSCICSTCHVLVAAEWATTVGSPGDDEEFTLEVAPERGEHSRLSCQIPVTAECDGLILHVPSTQA